MSPHDVEAFVNSLAIHGIKYQESRIGEYLSSEDILGDRALTSHQVTRSSGLPIQGHPRNRESVSHDDRSLYQWFTMLAPDRFEIHRPRHSECLRRRVL
jgi:hypothetical protein